MLLRRITKHITDQNWFAVFLDFFIVVAGILIAFQITNWSDAQQDQKLSVEYQQRLSADIEARKFSLEMMKNYYQQVYKHASSAALAFEKSPRELDQQFLIDLYQASQVIFGSSPKGVYDELLSTGRINLIGDDSQRDRLNSYYSMNENWMVTVRQNSDYRPYVRKEIDFRIQQQIRDRCGDYVDEEIKNLSVVKLRESCSLDVSEEIVQQDIEKIHVNTELVRLLRFQIDVIDNRIFALDSLIEANEDLQENLGIQ
jgi:hypothetical protein